jgi:hypothetical protein
MMDMTRRTPLLLLLLAAAALTLAACGSSGDGSSGNGPSDDEKAYQGALKFAKCMREHGVDVPDPKQGSGGGISIEAHKAKGGKGPEKGFTGGPDDPKFKAGQKACGKYLKAGGGHAPSPAEQAKQRDAFVGYARCMRAKGVNMPDPKVENGGISMMIGPGARPDSPKFKAADKACHPILAAVEPKGAKPGGTAVMGSGPTSAQSGGGD